MEFMGLSVIELMVIVVVAILVFGQRLPQVAGETAATLQRLKRSLSDLRRETGIDQEIYRAKREFEDAQREARKLDVRDAVKREAQATRAEVQGALTHPQSTATPNPAAVSEFTQPRAAPSAPTKAPDPAEDPPAPGPG